MHITYITLIMLSTCFILILNLCIIMYIFITMIGSSIMDTRTDNMDMEMDRLRDNRWLSVFKNNKMVYCNSYIINHKNMLQKKKEFGQIVSACTISIINCDNPSRNCPGRQRPEQGQRSQSCYCQGRVWSAFGDC